MKTMKEEYMNLMFTKYIATKIVLYIIEIILAEDDLPYDSNVERIWYYAQGYCFGKHNTNIPKCLKHHVTQEIKNSLKRNDDYEPLENYTSNNTTDQQKMINEWYSKIIESLNSYCKDFNIDMHWDKE